MDKKKTVLENDSRKWWKINDITFSKDIDFASITINNFSSYTREQFNHRRGKKWEYNQSQRFD